VPKIIIVAPHVDDEVIGCWSFLRQRPKDCLIVHTEVAHVDREIEARRVTEMFGVPHVFTHHLGLKEYIRRTEARVVFAPDPHFEHHPAHKMMGQMAATIAWDYALRFFSYSTDMNVQYLRETNSPSQKRDALNELFPSQKSLWENDHRFWLFEGIAEWNPAVSF
jgi:LmbE family N-acetylglucosaminyl deacetylase